MLKGNNKAMLLYLNENKNKNKINNNNKLHHHLCRKFRCLSLLLLQELNFLGLSFLGCNKEKKPDTCSLANATQEGTALKDMK